MLTWESTYTNLQVLAGEFTTSYHPYKDLEVHITHFLKIMM